MGWYIRKSKSAGPVRFNLSKSGIGVSTGVKGARVSFGPKGTYVNLGRNGIYYRKKIGGSAKKNTTKPTAYNHTTFENSETYTDVIRVSKNSRSESGIGAAVLKDIKRSRWIFWIWLICTVALFSKISGWAILLALLFRVVFSGFFKAAVDYEFDSETEMEWEKYTEMMRILNNSKKMWMIESARLNANTKVNAGAGRNVNRSDAKVRILKAKKKAPGFNVKTDVPTVLIKGKRCSMLFLPTDVFVKKGTSITAYSYEQLQVYSSFTSFIENGSVPRDAEIIRKTWQYVNKNGTADKRFKGNRQLPVCKYGLLKFIVGQSLNIEIQTSNNTVVRNVGDGFKHYERYISQIGLMADVAGTLPVANYSDDSTVLPVTDYSDNSTADPSIDSLRKNLEKNIEEFGKNFAGEFSKWLNCTVSLEDVQQYDGHVIAYYTASKDVYADLPDLETVLNRQLDEKITLEIVSESAFLAHAYIEGTEDIKILERPLSTTLSHAMYMAKQWTDNHKINSSDHLSSVAEAGVSLFDDDEEEATPIQDEYADLFAQPGSDDSALIDDMLGFLDEDK